MSATEKNNQGKTNCAKAMGKREKNLKKLD